MGSLPTYDQLLLCSVEHIADNTAGGPSTVEAAARCWPNKIKIHVVMACAIAHAISHAITCAPLNRTLLGGSPMIAASDRQQIDSHLLDDTFLESH